MVEQGEYPNSEEEITRLVVLVEGVPSFEFALHCRPGTKVSALLDKMRQYYYEGAAQEDLFGDEHCQQRVSFDGEVSQQGSYYLRMTERQVQQQIQRLYAPPEPPKPRKYQPEQPEELRVKTNKSVPATNVPSPEVKRFSGQNELASDPNSEEEKQEVTPLARPQQYAKPTPAPKQETPAYGTPTPTSEANPGNLNYNPYAQPQFHAHPNQSNTALQPVQVDPNRPPVVQGSGDCCQLI